MQLLSEYQVTWVNTIGMRRPKFDSATFSRAWEKLRHWSRSTRSEPERPQNLTVVNPWMWPWFSARRDKWINRALLTRQLGYLVDSASPVIAVTTLPITAGLVGRLNVSRWVYYCVDDFSEWPGLDRGPLEEMERDLVRKVDEIIVVSETLRQKMKRMGRTAQLLTHGVDLEHWRSNASAKKPGATIAGLDSLERPLVVFWGVIDRRMDVEFLKRLSADMPSGTIVLVGPESDPDPALAQIPRLVRLTPVPYAELPLIAAEAAVLIMPYADLPVTRAMQPLKLKEYLATGQPVVARDLPACLDWGDCLDLAATATEFSQRVQQRIADGIPGEQRASRLRLDDESWEAKSQEFARNAIPQHSGSPGSVLSAASTPA